MDSVCLYEKVQVSGPFGGLRYRSDESGLLIEVAARVLSFPDRNDGIYYMPETGPPTSGSTPRRARRSGLSSLEQEVLAAVNQQVLNGEAPSSADEAVLGPFLASLRAADTDDEGSESDEYFQPTTPSPSAETFVEDALSSPLKSTLSQAGNGDLSQSEDVDNLGQSEEDEEDAVRYAKRPRLL